MSKTMSKQTPLVLDLPKSDPLYGLDVRAVIEYDGRTFRHLHDLLDQRSREICRIKKELELVRAELELVRACRPVEHHVILEFPQ
jgi:hypothetical protein